MKLKLLNKYYENVEWKPWQADVLKICDSERESRIINWFWSEKGDVGKSYLARYIALKYDVIICDGKKNDIFNQIRVKIEEEEKEINIVLLDIPRCNMDYVNYGVIEQIKNGLIYSGKYEGGMCVFDHPHVIIFANEEPDYDKFSKDRWNVVFVD